MPSTHATFLRTGRCLLFLPLLFLACHQPQVPSAPLKASELFHLLRNFPEYEGAADGFRQALQYHRETAGLRGEAPYGFDTPWIPQGPNNIGGRINTLAQSPQNPQVILAGLVAGGIFKTSDGGLNWRPVFDDQPVLSISRILFDPLEPDLVYAATGDPNISSYVFVGQGLYKSCDAGETWERIALENAGVLSALAIDPQDHQILYAGSMGIPLRPGPERGLYRSPDGGQTWAKVLFLSDQAGITDILVDPQDPNVVYACGWHRVRNQAVSIVNGPLSRVYRSTDRGLTWQVLETGLPSGVLSRSGLAWSQGSVFVQFVNTNQQLEGLYRSDDQGETWSQVPTSGMPGNVLGGFGWYFCKLRVNPANRDDIFILGVDLWRTPDGGQNWYMATPPWWTYEVHADKHDLLFTPDGHLLLATDGGAYRSVDEGISWNRLDDIPATQFYRIAYNMHDPGHFVGGAQDNGTTGGYGPAQDWERIFGGDGFQAAFHPEYPELIYAEWQNGNLVVSQDYGSNFSNFTFGINPADRVGWDAPYFVSVHPPHAMYFGTNRVYQNDNPFTANWYAVSDRLTDPDEPFLPRTHVITALGESPLVPGLVLAGTGDGRLWRSDPASGDWLNVTAGLPQQYVTSCQGSTVIPERLFVTHSGYRYNQFIPHIHRSDDGGQTWVAVSGDLPPFGVNDLVILPGHADSILFAATDAGVFGTVNGGETWFPLGSAMPALPVYDIAFNPALNLLMAGTHARSFYTLRLDAILEPPVSTTAPRHEASIWKLFPNPVRDGIIHLEREKETASAPVSVRLLAADGREGGRWTFAAFSRRVTIRPTGLAPGVWYLEVREGAERQVLPLIWMP
jgi:photosystem II stability/assembly factor-like uncharacterized protein